MDAFVKSFATYRTIKKAYVLSSSLTLDSLDRETSTVTVKGMDIGRSNTGDWLIIDGNVYQITVVKPQNDRTLLTLGSPLDAFSRPIELEMQQDGQSIGGFIADQLQVHWVECLDTAYAVPYLNVSNSDTTKYVPPELDTKGCFELPDYCRLMRKSYRTAVRFADAGDGLICTIAKRPEVARQVSFADGHSQIQSVDYSAAGVAKITAFQDIKTGETDSTGNAITERQRTTWYLSEDGSVSQVVPARRAQGSWTTISVGSDDDVAAKVTETFAKNKSNHKLEFWSDIDLSVHDNCTFFVYGDLLQSYISYKRKSSTDKRFYYKSGELATTATEKLRGVKK